MSDTATINWPGKSGANYTYWIRDIRSPFKAQPGNYIFAKETQPGRWFAVYIGETEDLNHRAGYNEHEKCAIKNGATHIHAHLTPGGKDARLAEMNDLISRWKPPCNKQAAEQSAS